MQDNQSSAWARFKHRAQAAISFITPGKTTLKAGGIGILIAALLFFALTMADGLLPKGVGFGYYLLTFLVRAIPALLVACLISWAIFLAAKTPRSFRIGVAFTIFLIFYFYRLSSATWILIAMLVVFPALIFGALSYWRRQRGTAWPRGKKGITIISLAIGLAGAITGLYLFLYPGTPVKPITNYKMQAPLPEEIRAGDPSKPGNYKVSFLTYGSGNDKRRAMYNKEVKIKTPSVDASLILKSWSGIYGKLRTWFFGFDQTALPLNAMVWYPQNLQGPAPLVLVVHGNHLAQDWSEKGYDYLAELLASRGYIVASVDENFMNTSFTDMPWGGLKSENGVRGWLMLKHLELWRKWNLEPGNPFYHRVDMDRIALMGHSRGGEAMSHAALFNTLPNHPDDANEVFNFNFNIKAYVAIAPVDGQYKPASILAPLKDINYFVIQGTHDMDMQSYGGLSPLTRIEYSPSFKGIKAGLYVHHANHGQFSTAWGKYDQSSPYANLYNITNLMPPGDQQQIAKVYISAFLDLNLKGDSAYKPLFADYRYGRQWLPKQIYFNQFESSQSTFIARYEEDLDVQTATMPGVSISTEHLSVWREGLHKLMWNDHITRAAFIGWNREGADTVPGVYTFMLPDSSDLQLNGKSLVFSLAESDESSSHVTKGKKADEEKKDEKPAKSEKKDKDGEKKAIDFTLELSDEQGNKVRFPLSDCAPLQPQIQKKLTKFACLNSNDDAESIPDFYYFDLDALQKKHPAFVMNKLRSVRLVFDKSPSGVIILDDVGFADLK
jgi:dienelactone hydrolase